MKQNKYNGFLSKIRCSDTFKAEMEEKLSAAAQEQHEFTDVVDSVEQAPKRNIRHIITAVAACTVVFIIGGAVVNNMKNAHVKEDAVYSNLPFADFTQTNLEASFMRNSNTSNIQYISSFGQNTKEALAEYLNTLTWTPADYVKDKIGPVDSIKFSYENNGTETEIWIDSDGDIEVSSSIDADGNFLSEGQYYFETSSIYKNVEKIIIKNILESDFSSFSVDVSSTPHITHNVSEEEFSELTDYFMDCNFSEASPSVDEINGDHIELNVHFLCDIQIFSSDIVQIKYMPSDDVVEMYYYTHEGVYDKAHSILFETETTEVINLSYLDYINSEISIYTDEYVESEVFSYEQREALNNLFRNTIFTAAAADEVNVVKPQENVILDISDIGRFTFYDNGYIHRSYSDTSGVSISEYYFTGSSFFTQLKVIAYKQFSAENLINNADFGSPNYCIRYMSDSGQFTDPVDIFLENPAEFRELLAGCYWEVVYTNGDPTGEISLSLYNNFYICNGFMISEDGYLYENGSASIVYKTTEPDRQRIVDYLHNARDNDKLASLSYKLMNAEDKYTTMSADINADYTVERFEQDNYSESYAKYTLFTSGSLLRDNTADIHYIDVDGETQIGEQVSAELMFASEKAVYVEHGRDIDKLDNTRAFFKDGSGVQTSYEVFNDVTFTGASAPLDYFMLDELLLYRISDLKVCCTEGYLTGDVSDYYSYSTDGVYEEYTIEYTQAMIDTISYKITVRIDSIGNIVEFTEYIDGEYVFSFSLSDVVYDSTDFTMHEFTPEEIAYFSIPCEDFAEYCDKAIVIDFAEGSNGKVVWFADNESYVSDIKSELSRITSAYSPISINKEDIRYQYSYSRFVFRSNNGFDEFIAYFPIYPDEPEKEPDKPFNFKYNGEYYKLPEEELSKLNEIRKAYYESEGVSVSSSVLDYIDVALSFETPSAL